MRFRGILVGLLLGMLVAGVATAAGGRQGGHAMTGKPACGQVERGCDSAGR